VDINIPAKSKKSLYLRPKKAANFVQKCWKLRLSCFNIALLTVFVHLCYLDYRNRKNS